MVVMISLGGFVANQMQYNLKSAESLSRKMPDDSCIKTA